MVADAETVKAFGIEVSRLSFAAAIEACRSRVRSGQGGYVCFVNVHTLTESTSHEGLRASLRDAAYCFPDGMPIVWLAAAKQTPVIERVCGPDFTAELMHVESGQTHGLIGGAPGCAELLASKLNLDAITYCPPIRPFSPEAALEDWESFLARCPDRVPPRLIWVGLGAPKQELWMHTVSPRAPASLFFGVGAAFDFLSGTKPRAPRWLQQLGLEWAYRVAHEPKRLWRRYLVTNSRFAQLAIREILATREN